MKMQYFLFAFCIIFFSSTTVVRASVVINEVFPNPSGDSSESTEFVELFNTDSQNDIDISGFILEEAKVFTLSGVIGPRNYMSFSREETGLALNNSGDTITLKNSLGEIIDTFTFENSEEDASWSRYPDGEGEFFVTKLITKDSTNATPPSPTSTPNPTLVPTSPVTSTPTSSRSPILTKTPTPTPMSKQENSPTIPLESNPFVLSDAVDVSTQKESVTEMETNQFPIVAFLFISAGVVFIVSALYLKFKTTNRDSITYDS